MIFAREKRKGGWVLILWPFWHNIIGFCGIWEVLNNPQKPTVHGSLALCPSGLCLFALLVGVCERYTVMSEVNSGF